MLHKYVKFYDKEEKQAILYLKDENHLKEWGDVTPILMEKFLKFARLGLVRYILGSRKEKIMPD